MRAQTRLSRLEMPAEGGMGVVSTGLTAMVVRERGGEQRVWMVRGLRACRDR